VSYREAFSAAACALDVGVVEDEFTGDFGFDIVHLCP